MTARLLILSDPHLFRSRSKVLFGVNTYRALQKTTDHIRSAPHRFDLLIALGDLSEDGSGGAYQDFHDLSGGLAHSSVWVKGNHDSFYNAPAGLVDKYYQNSWQQPPWHLIFLDTTLPGRDEGFLGGGELERLERFLETNASSNILIFMHHQPVDVGSAFIDVLGLQNKQEFWEVVSRRPTVKAIIFGHVHQQIDTIHRGIRLLSVPSVSMQFKPHSEKLDFGEPKHGYRTITLSDDGLLETSVIMIEAG